MGSNIGKDCELIDTVVRSRAEGVARAGVGASSRRRRPTSPRRREAAFLGGADAISSSNTFPSLPLIDPETLEFEVNVDGQGVVAAGWADRRSCRSRSRRWRR